jgi:hypothetical protein
LSVNLAGRKAGPIEEHLQLESRRLQWPRRLGGRLLRRAKRGDRKAKKQTR